MVTFKIVTFHHSCLRIAFLSLTSPSIICMYVQYLHNFEGYLCFVHSLFTICNVFINWQPFCKCRYRPYMKNVKPVATDDKSTPQSKQIKAKKICLAYSVSFESVGESRFIWLHVMPLYYKGLWCPSYAHKKLMSGSEPSKGRLWIMKIFSTVEPLSPE